MKIAFNLEGFYLFIYLFQLSYVKHSTLYHPANICKAFGAQVCTFPLEPIKHSSIKNQRKREKERGRERAQKMTGCRKSEKGS